MKPIEWLGNSRDVLKSFPDDARLSAGYQLERVQHGDEPHDWKPMVTIGAGVREIRVREASGAFRVIYLAAMHDRVLVLHAFQKKSRATPHRDIEVAAQRLKRWKAAQ